MTDTSGRRSFHGVVHWVRGDCLYGSRAHRVFISQDGGLHWEPLFELPLSRMQRAKSLSSLSRRLFRLGVHHLVPFGDAALVLLGSGGVHVYDLRTRALHPNVAQIEGSRPLALCNEADRSLYYGEYRGNPERRPVRVFASDDCGRTWAVVHEFTGVRHVHGVYYDPYEDALWVTTGDEDDEAAVWVSRDRFAALEKVVSGGQQARAIRLLFTRDYVYFGTDTPAQTNHICRLARREGRVEQLQAVEGSVFHGCRTAAGLFFSTACEPSRVNTARVAAVWGSPDGESWRRLARFPKDSWPLKLFQYGQVFFAGGQQESTHLWLTPFAVRPDQVSLRIASPDLGG